MLASFFVVTGAKTLAKPDDLVQSAEPVAERLVPLAQRVVPASVSSYIPTDTRTLVRATGAAQLIGGIGLATGLGRRPGSALLAASMVPHVMASMPKRDMTPVQKSHARSILLRNVALLGAALIASQDTQGRPSLGYRAKQTQHKLATRVDKQRASLADQVSHQRTALADQVSHQRTALADQVSHEREKLAHQASDVVDVVTATTRRQRKALRKQSRTLRKQARRLGKKGRARSADLSGQLHANAQALSKQMKAARKESAAHAKSARKVAVERAKAARKANVEAYGSWLDQLKAGYAHASQTFASSVR